MPDIENLLSATRDIHDEQIVNDVIHLASRGEISVEISNKNITKSIVINNVTIALSKSYDFQVLLEQEKDLAEELHRVPSTEPQKRLRVSSKLNHHKRIIQKYVEDIISLAEQFNRIEINTERLRQAKEFFTQGEFNRARGLLESGLEQMVKEQAQLLTNQETYETQTRPKLRHNSEEFLLLAKSTQTAYSRTTTFEDSCRYYELSLKSLVTIENLSDYADFLREYNHLSKAAATYIALLEQFSGEMSLERKASVLRSLAFIYLYQHEYAEWAGVQIKAVNIYKELAESNPKDYLMERLSAQYQFIILSLGEDWYRETLQTSEETLKFYRDLPETDSKRRLDVIAAIHIIRSSLYSKLKDRQQSTTESEAALRLYRKLNKRFPNQYRSSIAFALYALGESLLLRGDLDKASKKYKEGLKLQRELFAANPHQHAINLIALLRDLAIVSDRRSQYKKAVQYYEEALSLYREMAKDNPKGFLQNAAELLNKLSELHYNQGEYEKTLIACEEALSLYKELSSAHSADVSQNVAEMLSRSAYLHAESNDNERAQIEYEDCLRIYRSLRENNDTDAYVSEIAETLNSLAGLHRNAGRHMDAARTLQEALVMSRKFAYKEPEKFFPTLLNVLSNFARLHIDAGENLKAAEANEEALEIARILYEKAPDDYASDMGTILINLAIYYLQDAPDREKSIAYSIEVFPIVTPRMDAETLEITGGVPNAKEYIETAFRILATWNLSFEEVQELISKKTGVPVVVAE